MGRRARTTSGRARLAAACSIAGLLGGCAPRDPVQVEITEAFAPNARAALVWFERAGASPETTLQALDLAAPSLPPTSFDALDDVDGVRVDVGSYSQTLDALGLSPGPLTPFRGVGRARTLAAPDLGRRRRTVTSADGGRWQTDDQPTPDAALRVTDERPCLSIEARSFPLTGIDGDPSMFVGLTLPDGREGLLVATMEEGVAWVVDLDAERASRRTAPGFTFQGGWRSPGGRTYVGTYGVDGVSDVGMVAEARVHTSSLSLRPLAPPLAPPSAIRAIVGDAREVWAVTTYGGVYSHRLDGTPRSERLAPMSTSDSRGSGVYFTGAERASRPEVRRVQSFTDQNFGFVYEFDDGPSVTQRELRSIPERITAGSGWGDDAMVATRFGVYRLARDGKVTQLDAPREATAAPSILELPGLALLLALPGGGLLAYDLARSAFCGLRPLARTDLAALVAIDADTAAAVTRGVDANGAPEVWVLEVR